MPVEKSTIRQENSIEERRLYDRVHKWVYYHFGKANKCENCGCKNSPKYEWSNKSGMYKKERNDWEQLCSSCHKFIHYETLSWSDINKIKNIKGEYKQIEIAKMFNINQSTVSRILNIKRKSYVSNN